MSRFPRALFLLALALCISAPAFAQTFTESVLANLSYVNPPNYGANPGYGPLILASDGNFYGTAQFGGVNDRGNVYKVAPDGTFTDLYDFSGGATDGAAPLGGLIEGTDGNFYGTTYYGGPGNFGTVFKLTPAGTFTLLYAFVNGTNNGQNPNAGLVQGTDGLLYGSANTGSTTSGLIFKISTAGKFTPLHALSGGSSDGANPVGSLIQSTDGNFYGTTADGGASGEGTTFKITPAGTFTLLHSFDGTDGYQPDAPLLEGSDGNFYSTTYIGSSQSQGTVFKMTPAGAITTLHVFTGGPADGKFPSGGLVYGTDGNFYGTTQFGGGGPQEGAIFQITPSGTETLIHSFAGEPDDGDGPFAGLVQGSDGDFYGTTFFGGSSDSGAIIKLAPKPAFSAPVQLSLSSSTVAESTPVTLSWKVLNAFSLTLQQCYAYVQDSATGAGTWSGKQSGTYSSSTKLFTGSTSITPTAAGKYTYALTCGGAESGFATLTVTANTKAASTTTITASPNPLTVGQPANLTAKVTGASSTPSGSVTYSVDGIAIGSANLNGSGVASLNASSNGIAPATYPVIATYNGNSTYNVSSSKAVNVTLNKADTSTTLTSSATSVTPPASVTLTATVTRIDEGATGHASGSVSFTVDGVSIANVRLNSSGVAILTASSQGVTPAAYPIKAVYSGDSSDTASTSSAVTVTVK